MEPLVAFAAATLGALLGFAASLVPGVHVNTLAALALAAATAGLLAPGPAPALALVAAFAASAFAAPVAGAFLGAPSEESAAQALPAHRLLAEGRGAEASDLAALGTFGGLALGLALSAALRPVLGPPLGLYAWIERAMPVLLLAIALAIVLSEKKRVPYRRAFRVWPFGEARLVGVLQREAPEAGPDGEPRKARVSVVVRSRAVPVVDPLGDLDAVSDGESVDLRGERLRVEGPASRALGIALGAVVLLLAGALGLLAFRLGARSPLGLPASPLLPLLAGLFGAPALLETLRERPARVRGQLVGGAKEAWPRVAGAVALGTAPGAGIGLFPGLTAAHAGAAGLALTPDRESERVLLVLGAANGAGVAFSLLAFTTLDRPRAGALLAAGHLEPARPFLLYAFVALAAACAGYFLARAVAVALARAAGRVPERALAGGVLALLVASTAAFTGALGLVMLATATAIGSLPLAWGVKRSHAMGVILVPVLARLWGLA